MPDDPAIDEGRSREDTAEPSGEHDLVASGDGVDEAPTPIYE